MKFELTHTLLLYLNLIVMSMFLGMIILAQPVLKYSLHEHPSPIELTIHDIQIHPNTHEVFVVRSATQYPMNNVTYEALMVDDVTEDVICRKVGHATIEEIEDNTSVLSFDVWTTDPSCIKPTNRVVAAVGKFYWTDHEGRARVTTFRSNPTVM